MYRVTRNCCLSGACLDCRSLPGDCRKRIIQADGVSMEQAVHECQHWLGYGATVEKIGRAGLTLVLCGL